jgi:hypothetical protein
MCQCKRIPRVWIGQLQRELRHCIVMVLLMGKHKPRPSLRPEALTNFTALLAGSRCRSRSCLFSSSTFYFPVLICLSEGLVTATACHFVDQDKGLLTMDRKWWPSSGRKVIFINVGSLRLRSITRQWKYVNLNFRCLRPWNTCWLYHEEPNSQIRWHRTCSVSKD